MHIPTTIALVVAVFVAESVNAQGVSFPFKAEGPCISGCTTSIGKTMLATYTEDPSNPNFIASLTLGFDSGTPTTSDFMMKTGMCKIKCPPEEIALFNQQYMAKKAWWTANRNSVPPVGSTTSTSTTTIAADPEATTTASMATTTTASTTIDSISSGRVPAGSSSATNPAPSGSASSSGPGAGTKPSVALPVPTNGARSLVADVGAAAVVALMMLSVILL